MVFKRVDDPMELEVAPSGSYGIPVPEPVIPPRVWYLPPVPEPVAPVVIIPPPVVQVPTNNVSDAPTVVTLPLPESPKTRAQHVREWAEAMIAGGSRFDWQDGGAIVGSPAATGPVSADEVRAALNWSPPPPVVVPPIVTARPVPPPIVVTPSRPVTVPQLQPAVTRTPVSSPVSRARLMVRSTPATVVRVIPSAGAVKMFLNRLRAANRRGR